MSPEWASTAAGCARATSRRRASDQEQQLVVCLHDDTLVLHLGLCRPNPEDAAEAWVALEQELRDLVDEAGCEGRPGQGNWWGITRIRRALIDGSARSAEGVQAPPSILSAAPNRNLRCVHVPVGRLWLASDRPGEREYLAVVPVANEDAANTLMFWAEREMPWLSLLEVSLHKIAFQTREYALMKRLLNAWSARLDRRLVWFVEFQRAHDRALAVGGSPEARELVSKLARATTEHADYVRLLALIDEAANTVRVNGENLRRAISALRAPDLPDDLLVHEEEWCMDHIQQMDVDRVYHRALAERAAAVLAMAGARMQVGLAHQTREQSSLQGIQTSIIASLGSAVALSQFRSLVPLLHDLPSARFAGLMLAWVASVFSLCQVTLNWNRENLAVDRCAVGAAVGFWALWGVGALPVPVSPQWRTAVGILVLLLGASLGHFLFLVIESREPKGPTVPPRLTGPAEEPLPEDELARLLAVARLELPDLLEDLPAPTIFRVKSEESAEEKLKRKGKPVSYLGDTIGIRYVVPAFLVPRTVRRVLAILNVHEIEYKTYDYRAVHIGATLHGLGIDPALDLKAEIQVKTRLQDWQATFSHDRVYKPKDKHGLPRRSRLWERTLNHLLIGLCRIECLVYCRWLRPPASQHAAPPGPTQ